MNKNDAVSFAETQPDDVNLAVQQDQEMLSTLKEINTKDASNDGSMKKMSSNYKLFNDLLKKADITLDGPNPWDIQVIDETMFDWLIDKGTIGFGESYMHGMWECEQIDEMINRVLRANIDQNISNKHKLILGTKKLSKLLNPQSIFRSKKDVSYHYDTGNDVFEAMLDEYMTYTCGYFKETDDLEIAQQQKLDLVCRKMGLKPGMRVLDIGCGWGSFMKYAAKHYGVICDGLTLSKEQTLLGESKCEGLPVTFILQDYREFVPKEKYDRVVSIGMMEHVGPANYAKYFDCAQSFLKDDGLFLLHTIGGVKSMSMNECDPWIQKYIFPNGVIPSIAQIGQSIESKFNVEDLQNIGPCYDKTLLCWYANFEKSWDTLSPKYDETFFRMWKYYLLSCAGGFRSRELNTWQLSLTKIGTELSSSINSR